MHTALPPIADHVIAIDGMTLGRSHDRSQGREALHLLSAWATDRGGALGQVRVADHENEIVALPASLVQVVVAGAVVTPDATGCQREVASTIVERKGAYVLALKGNHPALHDAATLLFVEERDTTQPGTTLNRAETLDTGHGRIERCTCWAAFGPAVIAYLDPEGRWPGLHSLAMVLAESTVGTTRSHETR